jgi:PBSX family phage terminase large subunit
MKIKLLPKQYDVMQSLAPNICYLGGVGAGKTHIGSVWILNKCSEKSVDLITANTYSQLHKATLKAVFKNFDEWKVPYTYNQNAGLLKVFNQKEFLCMSIDAYDNNRGIEVGNWWGDEAAYYSEDAYTTMTGRKRDKRGRLQTLLTTTPKGYNWLYDRFSSGGEKHNPEFYHLINCKTEDNYHLPKEYIESLKVQFDEKLIQQEMLGEFVNLTQGKVYYGFSREKYVVDSIPDHVKTLPIWISIDFNVDPSTAIIWRVGAHEAWAIDEVFMRDSNTPEIAAKLIEKGYRNANVIADSTGANRSTKGKSDHIILREAGFNVVPFTNPPVIDRVNNMNRLFSKDTFRILRTLTKTINDFEKVSWKGTDLDQKTDKLLTHLSDGAGYLAWKLWPIKRDFDYTISTQKRF